MKGGAGWRPFFVVRPAWVHSWGCKSSRKLVTANEVKRNCTRATECGEPFAQGVREILGEHVTVQVAKRSELHTFKVMPQRWVLERSFAWLEKNRRLWKNCEHWLNTSLQFVNLAFLALLLRRS